MFTYNGRWWWSRYHRRLHLNLAKQDELWQWRAIRSRDSLLVYSIMVYLRTRLLRLTMRRGLWRLLRLRLLLVVVVVLRWRLRLLLLLRRLLLLLLQRGDNGKFKFKDIVEK